MRQLALDIQLADHAVFESFHPGPNALAAASLQEAAEGRGLPVIWIWGRPESGKSHLLQAAVAAAYRHGAATAYLPLDLLRQKPAAVLDGITGFDLVALDDVPLVAGDAEWELALFRLYEGVVSRGGRIMAAGDVPPAQAGFRLADLASRLGAGATFRLESLSDDDCLAALQRRAEWRGFSLPEDTGRFLLARVARDTGKLFQLLDQLDRAALVAQKRLTIPFVKSVLEAGS